jgi:acyl-coenzyme A thioesterase 13
MSSDAEITFQATQEHIARGVANSPLYGHLLSTVTLISATPGLVICHLTLEKKHCNSKGGIHGAVSACIVDFIGGVAITAYDGRTNTGVSTDIHVTYLSSAKEGDVVQIEGRAPKVGGSLAFTECIIRKVGDGGSEDTWPIVAKGSHTKFVRSKGT